MTWLGGSRHCSTERERSGHGRYGHSRAKSRQSRHGGTCWNVSRQSRHGGTCWNEGTVGEKGRHGKHEVDKKAQ